jgi:lipopolysaccharide export system permease protein
MKKIDLYIIKKFLGTFFFMILAFIVIAIVFDISENVDDLAKCSAPLSQIIVDYYFNFAFYFGTQLISFIVFLTIIWFTSKLAQQSEIIAMLSGGISYKRIVLPYFMAACILVTLALTLTHLIVPRANKTKYNFEITHLKGAVTIQEKNIHREIKPGMIAYFYTFKPENKGGESFAIENWKNGQLQKKLLANNAYYNDTTQMWRLRNVRIRTIDSLQNERHQMIAQIDTVLPLKVDDFGLRAEISSAMTYGELSDFIEAQKLSGSGKVAEFEIEKYNRTATPFAIFVLTLIGVSIASRKQRGGTGLHLMLAIIIGFSFVFVARIMAVSAVNLGFPAQYAVWIPNLLFGLLAIGLYQKAQK